MENGVLNSSAFLTMAESITRVDCSTVMDIRCLPSGVILAIDAKRTLPLRLECPLAVYGFASKLQGCWRGLISQKADRRDDHENLPAHG